jgi:hypothetical protein
MRSGAGDGGEMRGGRRTARDAVARVEEGSKGENKAGIGEGTTRGGHPSRRWRGGGSRAAARAKHCRRQGGRAEEHVLEEEEERGGVRRTCLEIPRISGTSR